jgi:hypothetical protein
MAVRDSGPDQGFSFRWGTAVNPGPGLLLSGLLSGVAELIPNPAESGCLPATTPAEDVVR